MNLLAECSVCLKCNHAFPIKHRASLSQRYNDHYPRLYVIILALKWLLGLLFVMTMASISSNDDSDSGAFPSYLLVDHLIILRGSTGTSLASPPTLFLLLLVGREGKVVWHGLVHARAHSYSSVPNQIT